MEKIRCPHCGKVYSKKGIGTHIWRSHGEGQTHNPNRGYAAGRSAWNKGLDRTDPRVAAQADAQRGRVGSFKGRTHTEETKQKISKALSKNNHGGRCKWYKVKGVYVQGTWERDLAKHMDLIGIPWEKIKTNSFTFPYRMKGRDRHYTPDFRVQVNSSEFLLELKGYWWGDDKQKMIEVQKQNYIPNLVVVEKDLYLELLNSDKEAFEARFLQFPQLLPLGLRLA